jgi:filamentous hemagglutinin
MQSGIIELIVCRCKGQPGTEMSIPFNRRGGPHRSVPKGGNDAHHMPSSQSSPLPHGGGPTIGMDRGDHRRTASYGRGGGPDGPDAYRQRQKDLIDQGKFREAQQMDIDDVRNKFGNKYDDAINDMLAYTDLLFEVFAKCK